MHCAGPRDDFGCPLSGSSRGSPYRPSAANKSHSRTVLGRLGLRGSGGRLIEDGNVRGDRNPRPLRPRPNVPFNLEPVWIVECTRRNSSPSRSYFGGMGHGGSAARTETYPQPSSALVRTVLVVGQVALSYLHVLLGEIGQERQRATESTLAKPAVTHHAYLWLTANAIANRTANTAPFMNLHLHPP